MRNIQTRSICLPANILLVAIAAGILSTPGWRAAASDSDPDAFWHENTELRAMRSRPSTGSAAATEDTAPCAEVFDSEDFQTMLILQENWPFAFTLDLAAGNVNRHPASEVLGANGKLLRPSAGEFVTTLMATDDGRIRFGSTEFDYVIEPLPPMVGEITRSDLERRQPAYHRRASDYRPAAEPITALRTIEDEVEIIAFFGTWCLICKETLPKLLATLDAVDSLKFRLTLVGVDEDLSVPEDWIAKHDVEFTPTIVVLKKGVELGRIEEEALESVEADLVSILSAAASR